MAASAPVEVGAQGTIGSLVCREIEYFRTHGHGKSKSSNINNNKQQAAAANGVGSPRSKVRSPWKKGAGVGGAYFLPSICSSAEVAEAGAARVRYRHLGQEIEGDSLRRE